METKELLDKLESAQIGYLNALARHSGQLTARDTLKNVLFNNCESIVEAVRRVAQLEKANAKLAADLDSLDAALAEADAEAVDLKRQLAEAKAAPKPKAKPKAAATEE